MKKKTLISRHLTPHAGRPVQFPVSVKAVIIHGEKVVLAKNEREEWELPGGKLELGEDPQACVIREVEEELGLTVTVSRILDSWQYRVRAKRNVVIITYACECTKTELTGSPEHKEVRWFRLDDVPRLPMPEGYKRSVANWASTLESARPGLYDRSKRMNLKTQDEGLQR